MSQLKTSKHLNIPLEEIKTGTKNFQDCIGKGGYGVVYKGELVISGNPTMVAVKRLNEQYGQGLKEFLTEIQLLTDQKHPNVVSLLGYCDAEKEKIIVYEYAEHGSLDMYLRRTRTTLTWLERLNICVGAARGLDYLHNHVGKHQTIIHRDIKSANILIDRNGVAKISDLGLSKLSLAGLNKSEVISHVCGTPGYCEPEYFHTNIVKKESDVYSFGVVLFEVLCGRLACNVKDDDEFVLSGSKAKEYYEKRKLDEIIDPGLKEEMKLRSMNKFAAIAYGCLHDDRKERPPMGLVVTELEESLKFQKDDTKKEAGDKKPDDAKKPDRGPTTVVLKLDMHCDGCAKKIKKSINKFEGVESVKVDTSENKLTITGKVDPARIKEQLEYKIKRRVHIISPQPTTVVVVGGGGEEKKKDNPPEKKTDEKRPKEGQSSTVVLKIPLHCDGCIHMIIRLISKIDGVESVMTDTSKNSVTVKATMNVGELVPHFKEKPKTKIDIVPLKKDDDNGGDKKEKDEGGDDKKEKDGDDTKEKPAGGGGVKAPSGGEEKSKEIEVVNMLEYQGHVPYTHLMQMFNQNDYNQNDNDEDYDPRGYQPDMAMFSDENPNACLIM